MQHMQNCKHKVINNYGKYSHAYWRRPFSGDVIGIGYLFIYSVIKFVEIFHQIHFSRVYARHFLIFIHRMPHYISNILSKIHRINYFISMTAIPIQAVWLFERDWVRTSIRSETNIAMCEVSKMNRLYRTRRKISVCRFMVVSRVFEFHRECASFELKSVISLIKKTIALFAHILIFIRFAV